MYKRQNIIRLNNNVLKACYDNFCKSNECIALYSKFDITTGASVDEIRDTVLITFIVTLLLDNVLLYTPLYFCNCIVV